MKLLVATAAIVLMLNPSLGFPTVAQAAAFGQGNAAGATFFSTTGSGFVSLNVASPTSVVGVEVINPQPGAVYGLVASGPSLFVHVRGPGISFPHPALLPFFQLPPGLYNVYLVAPPEVPTDFSLQLTLNGTSSIEAIPESEHAGLRLPTLPSFAGAEPPFQTLEIARSSADFVRKTTIVTVDEASVSLGAGAYTEAHVHRYGNGTETDDCKMARITFGGLWGPGAITQTLATLNRAPGHATFGIDFVGGGGAVPLRHDSFALLVATKPGDLIGTHPGSPVTALVSQFGLPAPATPNADTVFCQSPTLIADLAQGEGT